MITVMNQQLHMLTFFTHSAGWQSLLATSSVNPVSPHIFPQSTSVSSAQVDFCILISNLNDQVEMEQNTHLTQSGKQAKHALHHSFRFLVKGPLNKMK